MAEIRRCDERESDTILAIVNEAAKAYRGVIPADRWREPYMPASELAQEIESGVEFWCYDEDGTVLGVMGVQDVGDVDLIRHAYVVPERQGGGIGGTLLRHLIDSRDRRIMIGTWAAASWAIRFYERHGFELVASEQTAALLRRYWNIPDRQIETSVVLAKPPLAGAP